MNPHQPRTHGKILHKVIGEELQLQATAEERKLAPAPMCVDWYHSDPALIFFKVIQNKRVIAHGTIGHSGEDCELSFGGAQ